MNKLVKEAADRELNRAISADEQANAHYYEILKRFITKSSPLEVKSHQHVAVLDASALKEIDTAWLKVNNTEKKLRGAYMKLYVASF